MVPPKYKNIVLIAMASFMGAFFLSIRVFNDGVPGWRHIITSDGRGYYAYLPALLLDHDPTFAKVREREAKFLGLPDYKPGYLVKSGDKTLNKYFAGEALLLLPFFLLGTLFSFLAGTEPGGYSFFFQLFTGIGTLFYLFAGLYFLKKIFDHLQIHPMAGDLALLLILAGTNLFYYSLWQPTMSHVFSFFAINGFLWFSCRAIRYRNMNTMLPAALFLGLVCLIRPTNLIVLLLLPFLSPGISFPEFLRIFWSNKKLLLVSAAVFTTLISIQGILWYIQTGRPVLWPYTDEGFKFSEPEIFNVLFSFRKGLFVYTPLIFISLFGLIPLMFKGKMQLAGMLLFLGTATYTVASWWNWYYGDGFGLRAFIDYYGVFAILLALLFNPGRWRAVTVAWALLLSPLVLLNLVQTWQYTHRVIHPNSMNETKYRHVFMRTDSAVINCLGGNDELPDHRINASIPALSLFNNFEQDQPFWNNNCIVRIAGAFSGVNAGLVDSIHPFSPGISIKAGLFGKLPASFFIWGEFMIRDSTRGASNSALVVLSMDSINAGENWWQGFRLNDVPVKNANHWDKRSFSLMTPVISNPEGILKVYIWNTGKKPLLLDDFEVKIYGSE
jgi:hypothetical protein